MIGAVTLRRVSTVVGLVVVWCALWGEATPANVASGLALSAGIVALRAGTPGHGRVRLGPLLRFVALAVEDLVRSTGSVAWEILTPTDYTEESIIGVEVPLETRAHLLLLTVTITVTPGTAVVDADVDKGVLYLHVLHDDRVDDVAAHVRELAELACAGLPTSDDDDAEVLS